MSDIRPTVPIPHEPGRIPPAPGTGLAAENERLRAELAAAQRRLEERGLFLAIMSHELREPMNGVLGMARLLRDTALDAEQAGYVEAVIGSAEALITLVNDILDLARIDAGRSTFTLVDFAIRPFLERLALVFRQRAEQKGIAFAIELGPDLPEVVRGDPGRLRQLITNIVTNGIKFTSEGEVRLAVARADAADGRLGLAIAVSDTGIGIPEERRADFFSPFAQADAQTARLFGGSGLGLMIAQRLAATMHGRIAIAPPVGRGTTFEIHLELEPPLATAPRRDRAAIAGARLLIADAQPRTARIMAELARLWGLEVRVTKSAAEALTVLRESADRGAAFDFAVIDRTLPDRRGDSLGPVLRTAPGQAGLKLILLVSAGVRGDAASVQALGFDAYLQKPVTASTLLDCLQQLHGSAGQGELLTVHALGEARSQKLRLLIADDNPVNCKLAAIMLSKAGHEVQIVTNGQEALDAVTEIPFDAVLMDVQMPVMGGLEATRRIRALPDSAVAGLPIIAITANAMRGDDDDCFAAGMNGYVTKPIDRATLLATVERLTRAAPAA